MFSKKNIINSEVLRAYGLSPQVNISRIGGTKNTNFCVTDVDRVLFLRRRHPEYCDEGWICFDHKALVYLTGRGVSVNSPLPCKSGGTWFREGDAIYEAYPWISGNSFPGTKDALRSVAEKLAIFHQAGKSFPRRYNKEGYPRGEMAPERLFRNAVVSKGISRKGDEMLHYYVSQVQVAARRLNNEIYHSLPKTLVHGDIHPANTIFDKTHLLVFVDYDRMGVHPVIDDLAFALILFCGWRKRPINGADIWSLSAPFEFDEKLAREFLGTYMKVGCVFPPQMRPALMEQLRLSWTHIRIDGARKVAAVDRPRFLARDLTRPFDWIEQRRRGDWF